jgi:hypothetical protein
MIANLYIYEWQNLEKVLQRVGLPFTTSTSTKGGAETESGMKVNSLNGLGGGGTNEDLCDDDSAAAMACMAASGGGSGKVGPAP